jgi:hypothetical protein
MRKAAEVLQQILDDDDFRCKFCHECDERYYIPETRIEPGEEVCPVDFEIDDPGCVRYKRWERIASAIEDAVEVSDCEVA